MSRLKTEAMCWLRYGKRMPIVCTEAGRWNADVLGVSDTMAIEVEVKISKSDLNRDFTTKTTKHYLYANAKETSESVPNYFYFFVPEALAEEAGRILEVKAPKAGLAVCTGEDLLAGRNVRIARKPVRLREGRPSSRFLQVALARMSSELCGSKQALDAVRNDLKHKFDDMIHGVVAGAVRIAGTLDCENETDLEQRAAELAFCVEGKPWAEIEDKQKWIDAAQRWLEAQYLNNREWLHEAYRQRDPSR